MRFQLRLEQQVGRRYNARECKPLQFRPGQHVELEDVRQAALQILVE
jgi:hypothetical protein